MRLFDLIFFGVLHLLIASVLMAVALGVHPGAEPLDRIVAGVMSGVVVGLYWYAWPTISRRR